MLYNASSSLAIVNNGIGLTDNETLDLHRINLLCVAEVKCMCTRSFILTNLKWDMFRDIYENNDYD